MKIKKYILVLLTFLFLFPLVSCSDKDQNVPLEGTWILWRGDSMISPYGRRITFQVSRKEGILRSHYSNGNNYEEEIEGRIDRLVFKPNGDYVLYHGGISFGKEELVHGLKGYEAGTYSVKDQKITLFTDTQQGFEAGEEGQRPPIEYKIEGDALTALWRESYQVFDPELSPEPFRAQIFSKLIFRKDSPDTVLPVDVPQNAGEPDTFDSPTGSFFGLSMPDNSFFERIEGEKIDDQRIFTEHALLGLEIPAKLKTFRVKGTSNDSDKTKSQANLLMLNRASAAEYLLFRKETLENRGFVQTVFDGEVILQSSTDSNVVWTYREFDQVEEEVTTRRLEAVYEIPPGPNHLTWRVYVVSGVMSRVIENDIDKDKFERDWESFLFFPISLYLTEDASFSFSN